VEFDKLKTRARFQILGDLERFRVFQNLILKNSPKGMQSSLDFSAQALGEPCAYACTEKVEVLLFVLL
jgi:hypothetical protein